MPPPPSVNVNEPIPQERGPPTLTVLVRTNSSRLQNYHTVARRLSHNATLLALQLEGRRRRHLTATHTLL